jgi:hypothetical protein
MCTKYTFFIALSRHRLIIYEYGIPYPIVKPLSLALYY